MSANDCPTPPPPNHTTEENHHELDFGSSIVFSVMVMLLVGQTIKHFSDWSKVPFTPLMCLFGLCLGLNTPFHCTQVALAWGNMSPKFMLMLFIPALIFESAFSCDYHTFKMQFGKIIILALPMLMASTFTTAAIVYYLLQH